MLKALKITRQEAVLLALFVSIMAAQLYIIDTLLSFDTITVGEHCKMFGYTASDYTQCVAHLGKQSGTRP